jgi:hypothetical protein
MTATKVWEYRHQTGSSGGAAVYKYSDRVGAAQRLENGNTIVWFGADIDPTTLKPKNPQTYTLVEADTNPEAGAVRSWTCRFLRELASLSGVAGRNALRGGPQEITLLI